MAKRHHWSDGRIHRTCSVIDDLAQGLAIRKLLRAGYQVAIRVEVTCTKHTGIVDLFETPAQMRE